jgi:hypothetical protein
MRTTAAQIFAALWFFAAPAGASVTVTVDWLTPGDATEMPPDHIIVFDVLVNVTEDDVWTAGGIACRAGTGAQILYARDPNTGAPLLVNPGTQDRFVTFFSRPRPRDAAQRFTNAGATYAGAFCPTGATPIATANEINVAFFAVPANTSGSPSVDGAVFRIALDMSHVCHQIIDLRLMNPENAPSNYDPYLVSDCLESPYRGTVSATFDVPTLTGISWGLYGYRQEPLCPADLDCDNQVALSDLALLLSLFGLCSADPGYIPPVDIDGDECIGLSDLTELLAAFGRNPCWR